ncbi:MAG: hydrogenase maturation protease, partial [Deltaproteobacteria bacterium]|nr:hydrogenase maturation protease [Deltaproteobacteria bacterium]
NRLVGEDAAGPRVFDRLRAQSLPEELELVDGGLAGLDLLRCADGAQRLVFVDAVCGLGTAVSEVDAEAVAALADGAHHHGAGLPYLLRALDCACDGAVPEVRVVGLEGVPDAEAIEQAAELALRLAVDPGRR